MFPIDKCRIFCEDFKTATIRCQDRKPWEGLGSRKRLVLKLSIFQCQASIKAVASQVGAFDSLLTLVPLKIKQSSKAQILGLATAMASYTKQRHHKQSLRDLFLEKTHYNLLGQKEASIAIYVGQDRPDNPLHGSVSLPKLFRFLLWGAQHRGPLDYQPLRQEIGLGFRPWKSSQSWGWCIHCRCFCCEDCEEVVDVKRLGRLDEFVSSFLPEQKVLKESETTQWRQQKPHFVHFLYFVPFVLP